MTEQWRCPPPRVQAIEPVFGADLWVSDDGYVYAAAEAWLHRMLTGGYDDE